MKHQVLVKQYAVSYEVVEVDAPEDATEEQIEELALNVADTVMAGDFNCATRVLGEGEDPKADYDEETTAWARRFTER